MSRKNTSQAGKRGPSIMRDIVIGLTALTSLGIFTYWTLVLSGVFKVKEVVPGYKNWFMSFLLPDLWIVTCSLLAAIFLLLNNKNAELFGLLTGSSLIFLGLYALSYGSRTGIIFKKTTDTTIELLIKLYCIIAGSVLIVYFY